MKKAVSLFMCLLMLCSTLTACDNLHSETTTGEGFTTLQTSQVETTKQTETTVTEETTINTQTTLITTTTQTETTLPEILPTINFADFDYTGVNYITIYNGTTGKGRTIYSNEIDTINSVIEFLKTISGTSPISNKDYCGFYYSVKLYKGDSEFLHIGFMVENHPGEYVFAYGIYEYAYGHEHACRYEMQGVTSPDVVAFFDSICNNT